MKSLKSLKLEKRKNGESNHRHKIEKLEQSGIQLSPSFLF